MATFPTLKTGAVAQYPLERAIRYSTQAVRFLDGSQQKFPLYANALRIWNIRLDQLDEEELGDVIAFAEEQQGTAFSFTDPVTGETAATCVIAEDQLFAGMTREIDGQASIVIEEIA